MKKSFNDQVIDRGIDRVCAKCNIPKIDNKGILLKDKIILLYQLRPSLKHMRFETKDNVYYYLQGNYKKPQQIFSLKEISKMSLNHILKKFK